MEFVFEVVRASLKTSSYGACTHVTYLSRCKHLARQILSSGFGDRSFGVCGTHRPALVVRICDLGVIWPKPPISRREGGLGPEEAFGPRGGGGLVVAVICCKHLAGNRLPRISGGLRSSPIQIFSAGSTARNGHLLCFLGGRKHLIGNFMSSCFRSSGVAEGPAEVSICDWKVQEMPCGQSTLPSRGAR